VPTVCRQQTTMQPTRPCWWLSSGTKMYITRQIILIFQHIFTRNGAKERCVKTHGLHVHWVQSLISGLEHMGRRLKVVESICSSNKATACHSFRRTSCCQELMLFWGLPQSINRSSLLQTQFSSLN